MRPLHTTSLAFGAALITRISHTCHRRVDRGGSIVNNLQLVLYICRPMSLYFSICLHMHVSICRPPYAKWHMHTSLYVVLHFSICRHHRIYMSPSIFYVSHFLYVSSFLYVSISICRPWFCQAWTGCPPEILSASNCQWSSLLSSGPRVSSSVFFFYIVNINNVSQ